MLSWIQHKWTNFYLLIIGLGAFMLFLYGFFPLKYHSGKLAHMDDLPNFIGKVSIDSHEVYNAGENTVILMVIDGLRYDFATEEYMPYMGNLINSMSACIHVTMAEPPTVTMPRIKSPERKVEKAQWRRTINFWRDIFAMMTGCVSTFADVALNFGAPAVTGDSVLRVAHSRGRRTVMYGDDTWLRLFPGLWSEYDGTTSFFVTDYTEVDNNVTRHLDKILEADENKKPKFDFLVLHYLGLDHIGHLEGARSLMIIPKLREMDDVVKKIHTAMQKWDRTGTLLICGDHGMRDAGGHGGASPAEILVPLIVIQSGEYKCPEPITSPSEPVAQVDMAPTIAWLLNSPIPGDSIGRILPSLMPQDMRQHLYLLHIIASRNAMLPDLPQDKEFFKQFQRAEQQFEHFLATGQESAAKIAKEFYDESISEMGKYLSTTREDFDMFAIIIAIILLYIVAYSIFCIILYSLQPDINRKTSSSNIHRPSKVGTVIAFLIILTIVLSLLTVSCFLTETNSKLCSFNLNLWLVAFFSIALIMSMGYFILKTALEKTNDLSCLKELNTIDYLLIIGTLFHPWTFFGTSFIEEEHMTWYYYWNTLMFFVLARTIVVVVIYFSKKITGATEVQEKPGIEAKMSTGVEIVPKWVCLIALHRYLRTMNQTGDRWLFLPDMADWLNEPGNKFYLQLHLVVGTLLTLAICLWNVRYFNNVANVHTILTVGACLCIICFRVATKSLYAPFEDIQEWDPAYIVDVFWILLAMQFVFEIFTYIGTTKGSTKTGNTEANKFRYGKPKVKNEDYFYDDMREPWNLEEVKLNLARSLSHLMLNNMMLIIILLMRPHNVIMVPSVIITCKLTSKCLDHKLLDMRPGKHKEPVEIISQALAHLWIGYLFFFYQGNSNSLASVDLGSGYVGLREYSAPRVALRMGLHAYAGPALAGACLFCTLATTTELWSKYLLSLWRATSIYAYHRIYVVSIYCVVAAVFRHHLFVWTVFSPKLLYDFVATVFSIQAIGTIGFIVLVTHVTSWVARTVAYKTRL